MYYFRSNDTACFMFIVFSNIEIERTVIVTCLFHESIQFHEVFERSFLFVTDVLVSEKLDELWW